MELSNNPEDKTDLSVRVAARTKPQEAAKANRIANETGLDFGLVMRNPDKALSFHREQKVNLPKLKIESPKTHDWLSKYRNAALAIDDVPNLSALEQAANIASAPLKGLGGAFNDSALGVNRYLSAIPAMIDKVAGNTDASDYFKANFLDPLEKNKSAFALSPDAGVAEKITGAVGNLGGLMSQATITAPVRGIEAMGQVRSVLGELQHTIPEAARTFALPSLTSAINTAFDVYDKTKDPIEAVKGFLGQFEASTANAVIPLSAPGKLSTRLIGGAASGYAVGEGSRQALNAVLPDSMQQGRSVDDAVVNAITGALMGGVMGPRAHHAARAVNSRINESINAIEGKARVDKMSEAVSKAELSKLSPEDMRKFIQHVAPDETVSLSAEDAATFFQSNPEAADALKEHAPEVYAQLAVSEATGSDMKIPMEDYLTSLGNWHEFLNNHIKVGDGEMSYADFEKSSESLISDINAEAERAIKHAGSDFNVSAQKVKQSFAQSLTDTGRFTPDVVEKYTELMGSITSSLAARTGMTPEAFADKYKLLAQTPDRPAQQAQKQADQIDHAIYAIRSGHIPTDAQIRGQSMLDFLREKGGLKDSGGELKARDANGERKPFQKNLMQEKGLELDKAAEGAHEAGFLPERDINKLLDAIDSELGGKPVYANANFNQDMEDQSRTIGDVQQRLHDLGIEDISKMSNAEVRDLLGADYNQSGGELNQGESFRDLKDRIMKQARKSFAGHSYKNDSTGKEINVTWQGLKHASSNANLDDLLVFQILPDVLKKAELVKTEPDYKGRSDIKAVHHYSTDIVLHGADKKLEIVVRELQDGQRYYDHHIAKETLTGQSGTTDEQLGHQPTVRDAVIVPDDERNVNQGDTFNQRAPDHRVLDVSALPDSMDEVMNHTSLAALQGKKGSKEHTEYLAAKNDGDVAAALNVVDRVLKPAVIENIRKQLDPNKPIYVVPVIQREGESLNMIPTTYAARLAAALGGTKIDGIVKTTGGKNTGKTQADRLMDKHNYDGKIPDSDGQYIIVDDNYTSGNTVVPLIELIQSQGGFVPVLSTLAISRYGKSFKPKRTKLDKLLEQTGLTKPAINAIIGHDLENLTGTEVQILLNATRQGDGAAKLRGLFASRSESGQFGNKSSNQGTRRESSPSRLNQKNRGSIQFPSPDLTDGASLLTIMETADLSTVIHEMGHFYFETLGHIASQPDAPKQIIDDVNTLISHAGVESLEVWNGMTTEERRAAHEQIAEEFEHYILEGKAPTGKLRKLFRTLKSWMISVYRNSVPRLSHINDDVRAVFDRLVASEDEIAAAKQELSADALFSSAEDAGMSDADYSQYLNDIKENTQIADEALSKRAVGDLKWLEGALDKELKAIQKDGAEKRKAMKSEVTADVYSRPVYAAWRYLSRGIVPEGSLIQGKARLSTAALRDMYGTDENALWRQIPIRTGKYSMVSKDGLHPDEIATLFGFDSGDALVHALVEADKPADVIKSETNRRMLERYGDLVDENAQREAAMEALHNKHSEKVIRAEYSALNKRIGRRDRLTRTALRDYADAAIGAIKVMDLRPNNYLRAERKASRVAESAFGKGDIEEAAKQKRIQMIQQALYSQAVKTKKSSERAVDYLNKFNSPSVRKKIDRDYLDQIDAVLEVYDLRKSISNKAIRKRQALSDWIEQQKEQGLEPTFDEAILAKKQHYKTLTGDELHGVRDAVKQIEHFGRLKHKLLTAKDKRDFDAIVDEAEKTIMENGKERPVELEGRGTFKKISESFWAGHRKLNSLYRQFDGGKDGGLMWEIMGRTMNAASDKETGMIMDATPRLTEIYEPLLKLRGGRNGDKKFIPAIQSSLTRAGRLSIALNWGNEVNRKRIVDGDHWNADQVDSILSTLTHVEAKFVNDVWTFIDEFWPEIAEKERRVTGIVPEKVMAEPFDMKLADGTTVKMRGGYYPVKYDADRDQKSSQHEAEAVAKDMLRGAATRATTRRGHTKQRVEFVGRPVKKSLDVITQHVSEVVHDLAWHEWLIDANRLMGSHRIDQAIRNFYGPSIVNTIKADIMAIAGGNLAPQDAVDTALLYLRSNVSRSTMGFSFTTSLMQPFGLFQSVVRIGPKYVLRGMARWGGDAAKFENSMKWISEKSGFMQNRRLTFNVELREINGRVSKGHSKARQVYDASMFMMMRKMQLIADVPTWLGAYEKALDEGNPDDRAVALANQAVRDSQGGGETSDLSEIQVSHPMLMMFASYFNTTENLMAESTAKTDFKNPLSVAGWMGDMASLAVVPALAPTILIMLLKGGEFDSWEDMAKKLAQWELGYLMGLVIGLREFSGAVQGFSYSGPPAGRVVTDAARLSKQVTQGEVDRGAIEASVKVLGSALGIPSTQALRSYKGWEAWSEGKAPVTSILLGPPPKD